MWRIEFDDAAAKDLRNLDPPQAKAIVHYLRTRVLTAPDPRQYGRPLRGDKSGLWRYRVGDFRIICQIQDSVLVVLVVTIAHRKNVYDR